jgi:pimeloyl-ACP methyl ester carboxylesterase
MPALKGFELVAFDQRGTGQSGTLQCPNVPEPRSESELTSFLGACGLAIGASRADYSSQESVEDLDALSQALGGSPLSLYGVSYGGRVAGMYAREHPGGVTRMVLDSPVPLTGTDALDSQRPRALERVLDEGICGSGACRSFSRDPYGDLTRLIAMLHRHPLRTQIFNSRGRLQRATVTEGDIYGLISLMDLLSALRVQVPAMISAAVNGYAAPLARLTQDLPGGSPESSLIGSLVEGAPPVVVDRSRWTGNVSAADQESTSSALSLPLFAATYCIENSLPWTPESSPATRGATFAGWLTGLPAGLTVPFALSTVSTHSVIPICMDWPSTSAAPAAPAGISATPTLILSGDDDLREPYEQDLTVAADYSQVQLLRIPNTGHSTVGADQTGCARRAMISFIVTAAIPASCPLSKEPQAFALPPASLSKVQPAQSRSRLAGEGAAAAAITLNDILVQPSNAGGGLRGGSWALKGTQVLFKGTVDIPGVALTGSIKLQRQFVGHVTVHGRVNGTLTLKGKMLSGALNGAQVHAEISE